MKVLPLSVTTPDWPGIDKFITTAVGSSPIRFLDERRISPGNLFAYILTLEFFIHEGINPPSSLREANESLDHIHLVLGVECNDLERDAFMNLFLRKSVISRSTRGRDYAWFLIISGTLTEWKDQVIRYLATDNGTELSRLVFNQVYEWFKAFHLIDIFSKYSPVSMDDGTFYLKEK